MTQKLLLLNGALRGIVKGDELVQERRASVHMLRNRPFRGWAVDRGLLAEATRAGAVRVRIIDTDTGAHYVVDVETLTTEGTPLDYGHGAQIALPIWKWRREGMAESQPAVDRQPDHAQPATPAQMTLFA